MAQRLLAVVVLLIVALVALRLAIGAVVGLVHAVLWIVILVALVAATLWARRTLKAGRRPRAVEEPRSREVAAGPAVDPVEVEMRRITEELRRQREG
jgi:protein-S-isoprenylcysteine O-methyltransferase Ste14